MNFVKQVIFLIIFYVCMLNFSFLQLLFNVKV